MPIGAILTFLHSVTPNLTPDTPKSIGILPDPSQVSVPNFKLVALKPFELCSSDPCDSKIDPSDPNIIMHLAGVGLNRKSPRATWARGQKNLQAQPHIYEPNIMREISIAHLNVWYPLHFAENRYSACPNSSFCIGVHISIKILCKKFVHVISLHLELLDSSNLGVHSPGATWASSTWISTRPGHF